eukprot:5685159-Prymnesium_polylepis.1
MSRRGGSGPVGLSYLPGAGRHVTRTASTAAAAAASPAATSSSSALIADLSASCAAGTASAWLSPAVIAASSVAYTVSNAASAMVLFLACVTRPPRQAATCHDTVSFTMHAVNNAPTESKPPPQRPR